jgi:hypothetical protein
MPGQLQCLSCGAIYPDTRAPGNIRYFHACPDTVIDQFAQCDDQGNVTKPATFKPIANPRDENLKPNPDKLGEYVITAEGEGVVEI